MASLGSLPPEVFGLVAGLMADGHCEGTLAALAATCRGFYKITMPHLYHAVAERHPALLHWAAYFGRPATAKRLVDAGAPVDMAMGWDTSEDFFKSVRGSPTPCEAYRLFRNSIDLCTIVLIQETMHWRAFCYPIHLAVVSGSLEVAELLVGTWPEAMAAPSRRLCECLPGNLAGPSGTETRKVPDYCLALHVAACHDQRHVVRWLLEHGCAPIATFKPARTEYDVGDAKPSVTALHDAARFGHEDMVSFILDGYQTDVSARDGRQLSPIWYAYLHRQFGVIDVLVAHGADIDDDIGHGYTPLIDACLMKDFDSACELIDRGADVNIEFHAAPPRISEDPIIAKFTGRGVRPIDICCWLLCKKPSANSHLLFSEDDASQTWDVRYYPSDEVWRDYFGKTKEQGRDIVSKLLSANADLGPSSCGHPPPLVVAAANHQLDIVTSMINHGASVNITDGAGVSPLAAAFAYLDSYCSEHPRIEDWVTQRRPFLASGKTRRECTPENIDPNRGGCFMFRSIVNLLLENGAEADQADVNGNTPLSRLFAAPCFRPYLGLRLEKSLWITPLDRARLAPLLLQRGANPKVRMTAPMDQWAESWNKVTDAKWTAKAWPRTPLEHAFWDANYEACELLIEAGVTPDQDMALGMMRTVLESGRCRHEGGTRAALEFIDNLPAKWRDARPGSALCFAIALRRGWLDLAQELWDMGLELGQFSVKVRGGRLKTVAPASHDEEVELGVHCLHAAARFDANSIVEGLLDLGVRPVPSCALLLAVHRDNHCILETLVKHGGPIHINDSPTDGKGRVYYHSPWQHLDGCVNPIRLALKEGKNDAIRVMLRASSTPVDPWFRYYYLKEACTLLNPSAIACLLEHPSMHLDQADIIPIDPNHYYSRFAVETDLPLCHLVREAKLICSTALLDYRNVYSGPRTTMEKVGRWMECVAAFAQAGVDATLCDRSGKSALEYLEELMAYKGLDWFGRHLAERLRAVGGLEEGEGEGENEEEEENEEVDKEEEDKEEDKEEEDKEGEDKEEEEEEGNEEEDDDDDEENEEEEEENEEAEEEVVVKLNPAACYDALKSLKIGS